MHSRAKEPQAGKDGHSPKHPGQADFTIVGSRLRPLSCLILPNPGKKIKLPNEPLLSHQPVRRSVGGDEFALRIPHLACRRNLNRARSCRIRALSGLIGLNSNGGRGVTEFVVASRSFGLDSRLALPQSSADFLRCSALDVGCSMFPGMKGPRYLPWFPLSNPPEYRIGSPCRCNDGVRLTIVMQSSQELLKKQFDRIGNRMDHLMIVMAAGKTLIVSSDGRGNEVVGCKKLVTRTGVQQPATKPKRQQLYFTHATPLEK
jgi:hypothetical protein